MYILCVVLYIWEVVARETKSHGEYKQKMFRFYTDFVSNNWGIPDIYGYGETLFLKMVSYTQKKHQGMTAALLKR